MRQLLAKGWMHNLARMTTASFLVKDLHLDWPPARVRANGATVPPPESGKALAHLFGKAGFPDGAHNG